ncbi:hypothetical protein C0J52_23582 [Blattella germanica]|nr:hypothetical protein C0J52_23582 [Blattella germanica]
MDFQCTFEFYKRNEMMLILSSVVQQPIDDQGLPAILGHGGEPSSEKETYEDIRNAADMNHHKGDDRMRQIALDKGNQPVRSTALYRVDCVTKMGIESSSEEEEDDGEGQEEQSLISWMIRGSLSLAMNDTLFL